jgi:uncharacterized membrane protein SirB2
MYLSLKLLHVGCAALSFTLFFVRGLWVFADSPRMQAQWVRIVPHVIDATLLASGMGLTVLVAQYPFVNGWLTVKVLLLVVYIGLGMVTMRFGRTRPVRMVAWLGAILVLGYIVLVAISKQPFPLAGLVS